MQEVWRKIALGSAAGLLGAVAMSLVMAVGKWLGFVQTPKPHQIEARIEEKTGASDEIGPRQGVLLAQGMHMLIGTAYGAGYSLLQSLINLPALVVGPIYGLVVYAINEIITGPSLDLTPPPSQEPERRVLRRVLMHLLFGLVIGAVLQFSNENFTSGFWVPNKNRKIRIG
jgi:hypothetical protein